MSKQAGITHFVLQSMQEPDEGGLRRNTVDGLVGLVRGYSK